MLESRNALAELAKRLRGVHKIGDYNGVLYEKTSFSIEDICKAMRIVAELAKVNTLGPKHIPGDISLYTAYARCRAIAEEGAKDGK